jgi:hypothetical protein
MAKIRPPMIFLGFFLIFGADISVNWQCNTCGQGDVALAGVQVGGPVQPQRHEFGQAGVHQPTGQRFPFRFILVR